MPPKSKNNKLEKKISDFYLEEQVCLFGLPMQTLKTNPAIQTLETNPANHLYPEPSPWPFWISAMVDNMNGGPHNYFRNSSYVYYEYIW